MKNLNKLLVFSIFIFIGILATENLFAGTKFYRASYRDDPATTITIGWCDDGTSNNATVYYGTQDFGTDWASYPLNNGVDRTVNHRGQTNRFARLTGLTPNTIYYFVIKDDNSVSPRMSFKTLPDDPNIPVMFINGGDTRTGAAGFEFETHLCVPRRRAGFDLVAKIRPDFVSFSGDFIFAENFLVGANNLWADLWEDMQRMIGPEETKGRIPALVPVYGNHEENMDLYNLFDIPNSSNYYAFSVNRLFRFYCLNSDLDCDPTQVNWFHNDLQNYTDNEHEPYWKFIQYHIPLAPHGQYSVLPSMIACWAELFAPYNVRLSMDGHAHTMKITHPIVPSSAAGSDAGYIQDDENGTVYIGEGTWGAPLRNLYVNTPEGMAYKWTKDQGKFAGFHIVTTYKQKYEVRAVKFDDTNVASVTQVAEHAPPGTLPQNLHYWIMGGDQVYTMYNNRFEFSNDASLAQLNTSLGTLQPVFNSQVLSYTVNLPAGTTAVPNVIATPNHPGATMEIVNATNLTGTQAQRTTQIIVTAEDLVTEQTYSVTFEVDDFADARLASISLSVGTLDPVFNSDHLNYAGILPPGTSEISVVSATAIDPEADVIITQATSVDGLATIIVNAADGLSSNTYTVNFMLTADDTKMITSFTIGGQIGQTQINEAEKTILVQMPQTSNITNLSPSITYVGSSISPLSGQAQDFTNPVEYTVTAVDMSTVVYTATVELVEFQSDNANLASLTVSHGSLEPTFNAEHLMYNVLLEQGTTSVEINAVAEDPNATVMIFPYLNLEGSMAQRTATVVVVAPDGVTSKTYSILFNFPSFVATDRSQGRYSEVFPNPVTDELFVKLHNNTQESRIVIHNGFGYTMHEKYVPAYQDETRFDLSHLPAGTYIVLVLYEDKSDIHRIIKIK